MKQTSEMRSRLTASVLLLVCAIRTASARSNTSASGMEAAGPAPLHACQERVLNGLFGPPSDGGGSFSSSSTTAVRHRSSVAPVLTDGSSVEVRVSAVVIDLAVVNHGVDGGALGVGLSLHLSWSDGRLAWDPTEVGGCEKVRVRASALDVPGASDIWVPGRHANGAAESGADGGGGPATVSADGTVTWDRALRVEARCRTVSWPSKLCSALVYGGSSELEDSWDWGIVKYAVAGAQGSQESGSDVIVKDSFSVPGYRISATLTSLSSQQHEGRGHETVALQISLDPLDDKCSICGIPDTTLREDRVPISHNVEIGYWNVITGGAQEGWTCGQLTEYMSTLDANTSVFSLCQLGRAFFAQPCCDGMPSLGECDANIHNLKVDSLENTVSPPDPLKLDSLENTVSFVDLDMLEVSVNIDLMHILGIDVRSNTMQVLVSLELTWFDERLAWDPFIGGCYTVSYRASLDAEQTEIWVPEVDLLNKVEGTEGLPSSPASVFSSGAVWWKRTGVLNVACDLTGLEMFPFDVLGCDLDFGVDRDSLVHRVRYVPGNVEFSDRIEERVSKHQEYQVDPRRTNVTVESEIMSAYSNDFVRFKFYFERAYLYYILMFILLYILFTYMSFGMFFLEQQVGERLGFGTSILFVIAAQDITMLDRTPVTPDVLWIYKFSFGCKVFVILGIVESLSVLYRYFHDDLDGDGKADKPEEQESLVNASLDREIEESSRLDEFVETYKSDDFENDEGERDRECDVIRPRGGKGASAQLRRLKCIPLFVKRQVLKYRPDPNDSIMKRKIKKLRVVDRVTALIFFVAYTVFWLVMVLAGVSSKEYECSDCFCGTRWNETTTSDKACPNGYLDCNLGAGEKCFAGIS